MISHAPSENKIFNRQTLLGLTIRPYSAKGPTARNPISTCCYHREFKIAPIVFLEGTNRPRVAGPATTSAEASCQAFSAPSGSRSQRRRDAAANGHEPRPDSYPPPPNDWRSRQRSPPAPHSRNAYRRAQGQPRPPPPNSSLLRPRATSTKYLGVSPHANMFKNCFPQKILPCFQ